MGYHLDNVVINKVLCFIDTSRSSLSTDDIISTAVSYYSKEEIEQAKKFLFKLCGEKPIARVSCSSWPDPCVAHVNDMIDFLERNRLKNVSFPSFLADGFDSLPPTGMSKIAESIRGLRDEVAALHELSQHRNERANDIKCLNDINTVQADVSDIKTIVVDLRNDSRINSNPSRSIPTMAQVVKLGTKNKSVKDPQSGSNQMTDHAGTSHANSGSPVPPTPTPVNVSPQKRTHRVRPTIMGTRKMPPSSRLSAAPKSLDLFVSRFQPGVKTDDIVSFCAGEGISVDKCELMTKSSASFESFKVTVQAAKRDALLDPSFWPEGIIARRFFNGRPKQVNTNNANKSGNNRSSITSQ